ncbi:HlyD family efflux transporter periplasmic adaptor subunit [Clostridiaceae bacterium UIB06]|uniref:HlyD family efflux transporter periplasmic adaptor subunit n=1 Tax=Clostridium thailandense TaxID=2794346 RepID=A0A949X5C8_9CLOT|nr:HlyD family efflux transporter periplasmic adaptor subunit [Clostridium thailandense]MCH5136706.1 HlyD family efflux transporter periplasmic adaptor subunit [Clostridiaceae bacterium UIB06]
MEKKKIRAIGILITLAVVASGGYIFKSIKDNQKDEFVYYGTAEADKINISAEIGGKIKEIKSNEGSKIKAGTLVAVIDSDENSIKLQDSELTIKNAENELGKIQDGNRAEEIRAQEALVKQAQALVNQGEESVKVAQNNIDSAQTNFDYKKKIYDDAAALYEKGADTKYKMDTAKNEVDNTSNTLNNAKATLESNKDQVNNYSAQLEAATEKLNLLVNGATERDKTTAQYQVDKAKNAYDLNKSQLDKSNIISANDGTIETINFKKGEYVSPGAAVATLLDTNNIWVKVYVPENALSHIKLDKDVTVQSDFMKGKTIKGKIIYISPEAEFTPMNIVTKKDRTKLVYEVKVKILDNIDAIKSGMLLDVNLK